MNILAVDPGASGGFALSVVGHKLQVWPMPNDEAGIVSIAHNFNNVADFGSSVAYVEQVGGYIGKKQPGSRMFNFGDNYGFIRGCLAALGIKTVLVRPQVWQKAIPGICGQDAERKRSLKQIAQQMFPAEKVTLKTADALLLLAYALNKEGVERDIFKPRAPAVSLRELPKSMEVQMKMAEDWSLRMYKYTPIRKTEEWHQMFEYFVNAFLNNEPGT